MSPEHGKSCRRRIIYVEPANIALFLYPPPLSLLHERYPPHYENPPLIVCFFCRFSRTEQTRLAHERSVSYVVDGVELEYPRPIATHRDQQLKLPW